jgi:hypothetical protein
MVLPDCKKFLVKKKSAQIFSDKEIFTVEASVNHRNNRWLAHDPDGMPVGSRIRFPASVCNLGVVSYEDDVMPLYFIKKDETVTEEGYLDIF